ncbi:MAG: NAD-dependent epimerase/dehydratase family protein [Alphaproteobacteria bacterium]|nr:NAD-dependent epimerase/dehydratase family protein [Alphaproteobacteria bacterium]
MLTRRQAVALSLAAIASPTNAAPVEGRVLVFGASGSSGSEFIKHLPKGTRVTAFVRPTSNRDKLAGLDVAFVTGDALNEADVAAACRAGPFATVFAAFQSRPGEPSPYAGTARNIVKAAKAAGVAQLIWIGQVGAAATPVDPAMYPDINFKLFGPALNEMSAAEKAVVEGSVPYTVIRVGAVIVERGKPPQPETGQGRLINDLTKMGPIAYGDLGRLAAECVGQSRCFNTVFHVTDDTLSAQYARWRCRRFATSETIDRC